MRESCFGGELREVRNDNWRQLPANCCFAAGVDGCSGNRISVADRVSGRFVETIVSDPLPGVYYISQVDFLIFSSAAAEEPHAQSETLLAVVGRLRTLVGAGSSKNPSRHASPLSREIPAL